MRWYWNDIPEFPLSASDLYGDELSSYEIIIKNKMILKDHALKIKYLLEVATNFKGYLENLRDEIEEDILKIIQEEMDKLIDEKIKEAIKDFKNQLDELNKTIDALTLRVTLLEEQYTELIKDIMTDLSNITNRLDLLENNYGEILLNLNALISRVDKLEECCSTVNDRLEKLEECCSTVNDRLDDLQLQIDELKGTDIDFSKYVKSDLPILIRCDNETREFNNYDTECWGTANEFLGTRYSFSVTKAEIEEALKNKTQVRLLIQVSIQGTELNVTDGKMVISKNKYMWMSLENNISLELFSGSTTDYEAYISKEAFLENFYSDDTDNYFWLYITLKEPYTKPPLIKIIQLDGRPLS